MPNPKEEKTPQNLPTIDLKGKEYVQVKDRIIYFNEKYPAGKIETAPTFQGNHVLCSTKVTPDITLPDRFFTGHSYGTINAEKAFEKLETVAVGRALAMMGIGVLESVASADEINEWQASTAHPSYPQNAPQDTYDAWQGLQMNDEPPMDETPDGKGCPVCGQPMKYKEGISKAGKPYRGYFCSVKDHPPVWVK